MAQTALAKALERQEKIIRENLGSFRAVGTALMKIRSNSLYRKTILPGEKKPCTSFDAYCVAIWGFGRKAAWKFLDATKTVKCLPAPSAPTSKLAATSLKSVPVKDRRAVAKAAGGKKATAKTVKAAAAKHAADKSPKPAKDAIGCIIKEAHVKRAFERVGELAEAKSAVHALAKQLQVLAEDPIIGNHLNRQRLQADLATVAATIRFGFPHAVCPYCKGKQCSNCKGAGWMPKEVYGRVPQSVRK